MRNPSTARRRLLARLAGLAVLAMATAACEASLDLDVTVARGGSGVVAVTLGTDAVLAAELESAGIDPLADVAATGVGLRSAGWQVEEVGADGGARAVVLRRPFRDPDELEVLAADLASALDAPELVLFEGLTLTRPGDGEVSIAGVAAIEPGPELTAATGWTDDEAIARLAEVLDYRVRVALPGPVVTSSGQPELDADGAETLVSWVVPAGERVQIAAVATEPSDPLPFLLAGGFLAAVLGAVVVRRVDRRRRAP